MRKTLGYIVSAIFLAAVFVGVNAYSQDDVTHVEDSAFVEHMRPPVPFMHDEHNETAEIEDCAECHHGVEDGKQVDYITSEDQECSECHLADESGKDRPRDLITRYHQNCKGCHLEKKAGPVQCCECHAK